MELTILGSGTCAATVQRSMASYHLTVAEYQVLLDIGAGSLRRMLEAGINYQKIEAILISHLHIDHIADLAPFLWATRFNPSFERTLPLQVFGPPGTREWYDRLAAAHGDWMQNLPFLFEIAEVQETGFRYKNLEVQTLPMQHGIVANGYRIENDGRVLAYSGDTGICPNLVELARRADVLLVECSFPDSDERIDTHMTPSDVGKVAAAANARKVILTHMYPVCENVDLIQACRAYFDGEIELAEDLKRLRI